MLDAVRDIEFIIHLAEQFDEFINLFFCCITIEAEAEEQAENKKALEIIKRRQKFYKKCGFTSYPNLDYELSGVKYLIFAYSNLENKIEDGKLIEIIKELYKEILSNEKSLVIKLK